MKTLLIILLGSLLALPLHAQSYGDGDTSSDLYGNESYQAPDTAQYDNMQDQMRQEQEQQEQQFQQQQQELQEQQEQIQQLQRQQQQNSWSPLGGTDLR